MTTIKRGRGRPAKGNDYKKTNFTLNKDTVEYLNKLQKKGMNKSRYIDHLIKLDMNSPTPIHKNDV